MTERRTRALVLGGGGVTGIAWEIGVLAGLGASGVDLARADVVIGTSAGAFVGVNVAAGADLDELYRSQSLPSNELPAAISEDLMNRWFEAFGAGDLVQVAKAFGAIALANPEPVPIADRRAVVERRVVTQTWPETLRVTAIDAESGEQHVLGPNSGLRLVDAVSASGAVPGVWPVVEAAGRRWIDGGMVSATNARMAEGYDSVVVLSPMAAGFGVIPSVQDDVDALRQGSDVVLLVPDELSIEAIGTNPFDPERRAPVAAAGRNQGLGAATEVHKIWS